MNPKLYNQVTTQHRKILKEISEDYGNEWIKGDKDWKRYKKARLESLIELMSLEIDRVPHKGVETIMNEK